MSQSERGQAMPLLMVPVIFIAVLILATGKVIGNANSISQAQTAADAVALAGVIDGRAAAEAVAKANGAQLIGYQVEDGEVQVTTRIASDVAKARAAPGNPHFPDH